MELDNATDIAQFLLDEEGEDGAVKAALDGIARAHANKDYYLLSVWREVRIILRQRQAANGETESA